MYHQNFLLNTWCSQEISITLQYLKIQYAKTLIVFETHLQEDSCHQVRAYSPTGFPTNSTAQRLRRMSAVCATLTRPRAACVSVVAAAARACLRARQSSARWLHRLCCTSPRRPPIRPLTTVGITHLGTERRNGCILWYCLQTSIIRVVAKTAQYNNMLEN